MLLLSEDDVRHLLTMDVALEAVEHGLRSWGLDEAVNNPRTRCQTDHAMLHVLSASGKRVGALGFKAYVTSKKEANFHVTLYDGKTGMLLAMMRADYLGQMRTGAASGVATKLMARPDSCEVGIFGSGKQARTQLQAICKVRPITHVSVYSFTETNRQLFADEMSKLLNVQIEPVHRPEQAAEDKDIVITATSSREPVLSGEWISDGTHLNVIGSNFLGKREIDVDTLRKSANVVVDSKDQAKIEAGDFVPALESGAIHWADVRELSQIIVGRHPGRVHTEDITLFKSLGIGIEDVAVAAKVYQLAKAAGLGREVEF